MSKSHKRKNNETGLKSADACIYDKDFGMSIYLYTVSTKTGKIKIRLWTRLLDLYDCSYDNRLCSYFLLNKPFQRNAKCLLEKVPVGNLFFFHLQDGG